MSALIRWGRFNLVGAMGVVVQLAALSLFNLLLTGHYLYASAMAVELALLHNFAWHWHYTWRDRRVGATPLRPFIRFHLSNGLVSVLGNLALMRLLMHRVHLPLLFANGIAILCCSVANFLLGDHLVFARTRKADPLPVSRLAGTARCQRLTNMLSLLLFGWVAANAQAQSPSQESTSLQTATQLPDAPHVQPTANMPYRVPANASYLYHVGLFCGVGASTSSAATKPMTGCGAGMTLVPIPVSIEVGIMAPQANRSYLSGYVSVDGSIPLAPTSSKYLPMALFGYSRLFETGHSLDYGLALALPHPHNKTDDGRSLRLELRDYWTFASPAQHNIMLRIGWMAVETD